MTILLSGALGRMGREIAAQAEAQGIRIIAGVDAAPGTAAFPLYPRFADVRESADALIDFSHPSALEDLLAFAEERHMPAVLCATGYTDEQLRRIDRAAEVIPIFRSANMSVGIALLRSLTKKAAQVLGDDFDPEIVEMHHRRKLDAPSGTARAIYDSLREAYSEPRTPVYGREGRDCRRQPPEIGMHAVRGGTVVGEHQVLFLGNGERITLSHSAENRGVFAAGALRAAAYLLDKPAGLYSMDDLVG